MKKVFICVICAFYLCNPCLSFSETLNFDRLNTYLEKTYLKPLAKDIGSVLAGGMFHSGRTLGFPGFDVGIGVATSMKPSKDNKILKESFGTLNNPDDKMFGLPFLQVSVGLPKKIDIIVRGYPETHDMKLLGAGLKYCLVKQEIAVVELGLSAMYSYNSFEYKTFKADVHSLAGIFSIKIPVVEPYLGIAVDKTSLETEFTTAELQVAGKTLNLDVSTTEPRYVLGFNFSMIPFTYINVAGTYLIDHFGVDFGLGVKF